MGSTHNFSEQKTIVESRISTTKKLFTTSIVFFFLQLLLNMALGIYVIVRHYTFKNYIEGPPLSIHFSGAFFALISMILGIVVYFRIKDNLSPFYRRKIKALLWLMILYTLFVCIIDDLLLYLTLGIISLIFKQTFFYYLEDSRIVEYYIWCFGDTPKNIVSFIAVIVLIITFVSISKDIGKGVKKLVTPFILIPFLLFSVFASYDILWNDGIGILPSILLSNFDFRIFGLINFLVVSTLMSIVLLEVVIKIRKLDMEILA